VIVVVTANETDVVRRHHIITDLAVALDGAELADIDIRPNHHPPRRREDRPNSYVKAGTGDDVLADPKSAIDQLP